jgi:hypothetical protein
MVRGFDFQPPRYGIRPAAPNPQPGVWGPVDMAAQLQKGISGIGDAIGSGYTGMNQAMNKSLLQKELQSSNLTPAQQLLQLGGQVGSNSLAGGTGATGGGGGAASLSPWSSGHNDLVKSDMAYLTSKGLSPVQAAGIVGHGFAESGNNPIGAAGDAGRSNGYFQWDPQRFANMKAFAAKEGKDWRDRTAQLDFALYEAKNDPRVWDSLSKAQTVEDATTAWMHFERPQGYTPQNPQGGLHYDKRLGAARRSLGLFGGTASPAEAQGMNYGPRPDTPAPQQAPAPVQQPPAPAQPVRDPRQVPAEPTQGDQLAPSPVAGATGATGLRQGVQIASADPNFMPAVPALAPNPSDAQGAQQVVAAQAQHIKGQQPTAAPAQKSFLGQPLPQSIRANAGQPAGAAPAAGIGAVAGPGVPSPNPAPPAPLPQQAPLPPPRPAEGPPAAAAPAPAPQAQPQVITAQDAIARAQAATGGGQGAPNWGRLLSYAIGSGDSSAVQAIYGLMANQTKGGYGFTEAGGQIYRTNAQTGTVEAVAGTPKGNAAEWSVEKDGSGNLIRVNKVTGESSPVSTTSGTMANGDLILPPKDPRRAQFPGLPDDNRTWRVRPTERGPQFEPLDEREAKDFERTQTLAGALESNDQFKTFRAQHAAVNQMEAALKEGNAAGDFNATLQAFKVVDPGSTVSQNEQTGALELKGASGIAQYWQNKLNLSNGILTQDMRAELFNAAHAQLQAKWNLVKPLVEGFRNRAKLAGLDPGAATNYYEPPTFDNRATYESFPNKGNLKPKSPADAATGPVGSSPAAAGQRAVTGQPPARRDVYPPDEPEGSSADRPIVLTNPADLAKVKPGEWYIAPGMLGARQLGAPRSTGDGGSR